MNEKITRIPKYIIHEEKKYNTKIKDSNGFYKKGRFMIRDIPPIKSKINIEQQAGSVLETKENLVSGTNPNISQTTKIIKKGRFLIKEIFN
jgi:hypothetical protein